MTQLSNTNLLDQNVGENLKSQRLEKTSQIAMNPNTETKRVVQQQQQQQAQTQQMQEPNKISKEEENVANRYENEHVPNNLSAKDYGKEQTNSDADEKKIFGLKPMVFYGLLAVGLGVAGYFAYKHFKVKNGKGGKVDGGAGAGKATTPTATAEVKITDVPITK